jgi:hypothetical protein
LASVHAGHHRAAILSRQVCLPNPGWQYFPAKNHGRLTQA